MALTDTQIQQLYTAYLGRPADQAGINYWQEVGVNEFELRANLANDEQPEYVELYGDRTRSELVTAIYQNMFGREPEAEGLLYWVEGDGSSVPASELQQLFISAASEEDSAAFDARVAEDLSNVVPLPPQEGESETVRLTQQADNLQGTDGADTTFVAPVTQNETGSGALANTFETGDVLDGGTGNNTLRADLIASGAVSDNWAPAISAETTNIQNVFLRAQTQRVDEGASNTTFGATIDAEKMVGVEQWWSDNSRADIRIEDIRTATQDTTFGLRETDPEVGFEAYFNPLYLEGDLSADSSLSLLIQEIDGNNVLIEKELADVTVREVNFSVGSQAVTLSSDAIRSANTWAELEAALAAEIEAQELTGLSVTHQGNGQFLIDDAQGRPFDIVQGEALIFGAAADIDVRNRVDVGRFENEGLTETTLILDGAGNGSRGGDVNIAAMSGNRGIELMNVEVDRDSHIRTLRSENNPRDTGSYSEEQQLEEVYLTHVEGGAQGAFQLGSRTVDNEGVSTTTDDRLNTDGLINVRTFDATGFSSAIKLGATLDDKVFDKYLDDAEGTVQFSYLLGNAGNNLSLAVDNSVAADPDFALEIVGGAGDDRINLTGLATKNSTEIDGAGGNNTVEVDTTTAGGANRWASFENIQNLVVAGANNTVQNVVTGNMGGLETITVATENGVDTNLQQLRMDQAITVSGKNQTLGSGNSTNNQLFGEIKLTDTSAVPGINSFSLTLENTARVDGDLSVANLVVDGANSALATLDVTSATAGRRDTNTTNTVEAANLGRVTTVNFDGTQDLEFNIASMATGNGQTLTANGSALEGNLSLGVVASNLIAASADTLVGTAGGADKLTFTGNFTVDGNGHARASTNVSEFETVQLGTSAAAVSGRYDAANTSGVELYNFVNVAGSITLDGLRGTENVRINDIANATVALNAGANATSNTLNAEIRGSGNPTQFDGDLIVEGFRTINLDLNNTSGEQTDFTPDLVLNGFGEVGANVADVNNGDAGSNYARAVNLEGGRDVKNVYTGGELVTDRADTLTLNDLSNSLNAIDVSGFKGSFEGSFTAVTNANGAAFNDAALQQLLSNNSTITLGEYEFYWNNESARDNGVTTVTTFRFTEDAYADGVVWQIDGFKQASGDARDLDILNLRDLGVNSQSDLNVTYGTVDAAGDFVEAGDYDQGVTDAVMITSNQDQNFTILLTGLDTTNDMGLVGDNFLFA